MVRRQERSRFREVEGRPTRTLDHGHPPNNKAIRDNMAQNAEEITSSKDKVRRNWTLLGCFHLPITEKTGTKDLTQPFGENKRDVSDRLSSSLDFTASAASRTAPAAWRSSPRAPGPRSPAWHSEAGVCLELGRSVQGEFHETKPEGNGHPLTQVRMVWTFVVYEEGGGRPLSSSHVRRMLAKVRIAVGSSTVKECLRTPKCDQT